MRCNGHPTFAQQPDAAVFSQPTAFSYLGAVTAGVTMTLSPKTAQGGDDLQYPRHVGSPVLNALFGASASGSANGGFSSRELIGQTGIDVRDQTAKQPAGNTPIFPCYVFDTNKHSWNYDVKSRNWKQAS
jgi:hypothetical protein